MDFDSIVNQEDREDVIHYICELSAVDMIHISMKYRLADAIFTDERFKELCFYPKLDPTVDPRLEDATMDDYALLSTVCSTAIEIEEKTDANGYTVHYMIVNFDNNTYDFTINVQNEEAIVYIERNLLDQYDWSIFMIHIASALHDCCSIQNKPFYSFRVYYLNNPLFQIASNDGRYCFFVPPSNWMDIYQNAQTIEQYINQ